MDGQCPLCELCVSVDGNGKPQIDTELHSPLLIEHMDTENTTPKTISGTYRPQDRSGITQLHTLRAYKRDLEEAQIEEIRNKRSQLAAKLRRARARQRLLNEREVERHKKAYELSIEQKALTAHNNALIQSEEKIHALAYQMAQSVVEAECKRTSEALITKLRKKISELTFEPWWKLRVSEQDLEEVRTAFDTLQGVTVEVDSGLSVGNGSLTTPSGTITIDWAKHLDCVYESLVESKEQLCLPPSRKGESA